MSAALRLNREEEKLSRKPPLGEKVAKPRLVWENPDLSHGTQKEKPKVRARSSYGRVLYNYFRDYDPTTGRYVQSDPIGLEGGLNTYAYVHASPLNLFDLLGLDSVLIFPTEPDPSRDPPDAWDLPAQYAKDLTLKSCECGSEDVHIIPVKTVEEVNTALTKYKDIVRIYFIGHSSSDSIYVGSGDLPGTNISPVQGKNNVSPSSLNWANFKPGAKIFLWGCDAGDGAVAQSISDASKGIVFGPDTYLNFDENNGRPFIRSWRFGSWKLYRPK